MVSRIGRAVAEIRTGARNRNENGFCRPPVMNSKPGQFDDVERKQGCGIDRLQPLHRIEGGLYGQIDQRRQADDRKAGNDRQIEIQPLGNDEDGGELAEHRKPAQPQNGVQTDIAARVTEIGGSYIAHVLQLIRPIPRSQIGKQAREPCACGRDAPMNPS